MLLFVSLFAVRKYEHCLPTREFYCASKLTSQVLIFFDAIENQFVENIADNT